MTVFCAQSDALDARILTIESSITKGFAGVHVIGNVSEVCKNGIERAKNALDEIGVSIPNNRVVVNIAPGDLKKNGSQFDVSFAICLYHLLSGNEPNINLEEWLFIGELGLTGDVRPVKSVVSYVIAAVSNGFKGIVLPEGNYLDAKVLSDFDLPGIEKFQILGFSNLRDIVDWAYDGAEYKNRFQFEKTKLQSKVTSYPNFDDMILTPELEKAALVVASGLHSMLLYGTPGTGKSMLASRMTSILPMMEQSEHMDALSIMSCCKEFIPSHLLAGRPPFRSPHHQATSAAILGTSDLPGELSLAHGGMLFLDEFPEFRRDIIEALREPLETGEVQVSRAKKKVSWKSKICLIAAANNCPCGWYGSSKKSCKCPHGKVEAYRRKISGPILDRIDIHVNIPESKEKKSKLFLHTQNQQVSKTVVLSNIVEKARKFSQNRNHKLGVNLNCDLQAHHIIPASGLTNTVFSELIDDNVPKATSSRGIVRAMRVARTLADLECRNSINEADVNLALKWQADGAAKERGDDIRGL